MRCSSLVALILTLSMCKSAKFPRKVETYVGGVFGGGGGGALFGREGLDVTWINVTFGERVRIFCDFFLSLQVAAGQDAGSRTGHGPVR